MRLEVTNLSCGRGGRPVLAGVSVALGPGQGLVLRGPNGAGKTTLLRCLAGLSAPLAGQIVADAEFAYFGHLDAVKPQLTVRENLTFWARIAGVDGARIAEGMMLFGLEELAERPAARLSAGQRRRLGLARLALAEGCIWLMDEPTVALDAANVARLEAALGAHLARGGVAVVATHTPLSVPGMTDFDVAAHAARAHATADENDPFLAGFPA